MDLLLEFVDAATKHGVHKWALVVLGGGVLKILKSLANQWLEERKVLLDELRTSRAEGTKLAENHITHLQQALTDSQKEVAGALMEMAKAQLESANSINHMTERLKEGFSDLKDILKDQRQI